MDHPRVLEQAVLAVREEARERLVEDQPRVRGEGVGEACSSSNPTTAPVGSAGRVMTVVGGG